MPRIDLHEAVRRLCLSCPESEEIRAHGMSKYRVRGGRTFAMYAVNHHGDGRIALWLNVSSGVQDAYLRQDSRHFFMPPYVGPRGWLGVRLDLGIAWKDVVRLVRIGFQQVAPARLREAAAAIAGTAAPTRRMTAADVDPKITPRGRRVLAAMRKCCLRLPETSEGTQFGRPVWRVGKRAFAHAYCDEGRWRVAFWVGVPMQALMTRDARFEIPPYLGHHGWIALDVSRSHRERELSDLARESHRHFAPKAPLRRRRQPQNGNARRSGSTQDLRGRARRDARRAPTEL